MNVPVSLGGMLVTPGDLIVGDANGVIAVPYDDIDFVVQEAKAIQQREDGIVAQIGIGAYGMSFPPR